MSTLYKTSGLVVEIDDDPANPNQPRQPGKVIPGESAQEKLARILNLHPETKVATDSRPPSPTGNSPRGPGGNFILLSSLLGSGGGRQIPPGATIVNDL